jgi:hypothetical protein
VKSLGKIVLAGFKGPNGFFKGPHRVSGVCSSLPTHQMKKTHQ